MNSIKIIPSINDYCLCRDLVKLLLQVWTQFIDTNDQPIWSTMRSTKLCKVEDMELWNYNILIIL